MSRLLEARARLLGALEAGGLRTATGGRFAAPCILVEPGEPWSEPSRMPGRTSRWKLTAIGGKSDTGAAVAELADLIDAVDAALRPLDGAELPSWTRPLDYELGGIPYAASVATIQYASS